MRLLYCYITLFFSLTFYAQKKNISVVSADKMNVLYRGISNPISIAVPNCKSFTVIGKDLVKKNNKTYAINPGPGLESIISIKIILKNGTKVIEQHKFRIKNLPEAFGAINGLTCKQSIILMSKKELENAIITIDFPKDFLYELKLDLEKFEIKIDDNQRFVINGNKFTKEVLDVINKLPINSVFEILNITSNIHCDNCSIPKVNPLSIMIVEDE